MDCTLTVNLGASASAGTNPTIILGSFLRGQTGVLHVVRVLADTVSTSRLKITLDRFSGSQAPNILASPGGVTTGTNALYLIVPSGVANGIQEYNSSMPWIYPPPGIDLGQMSFQVKVTDWADAAVTYTNLALQVEMRPTLSLPRLPDANQQIKELRLRQVM